MEHNFNRPTPWSVLRGAGLRACIGIAALYASAAIIGFAAAIEMGLVR